MRIQLAMNVRDLHESIAFYSKLFGAPPSKVKEGYANWALEDPPLKFVIIENDTDPSGTVNHLGVEVDSAEEVMQQESRLRNEGLETSGIDDTICCFAEKVETWVDDPNGPRWEYYVKTADHEAQFANVVLSRAATATQPTTPAVDDQPQVISDRHEMVRSMDPQVVPGIFVFATVPQIESVPDDVDVYSTVREAEALSVVIAYDDAHRFGLTEPVKLGWITLTVNSSLEGVGLTAAVSGVLAEHGIACNVIAGHHHDHLLVPVDEVNAAIQLLKTLADQR